MAHRSATRFVFVTGGNISGLGKGIASATLGLLLKAHGYRVTALKMDPYLNVDAGTMNPIQHGEVFVTEDGAETDLDLGHYERFLNTNLTRLANVTAGQVYQTVIDKERKGEFLGATVQVIPHVTNEIKARIRRAAMEHDAHVCIVETGGTVGDIEGLPFLEAIRQLRSELGRPNYVNLHVTLVPKLGSTGEVKTKLTQHSVRELRSIGIQPDMILCRTSVPLPREVKEKIALFTDVDPELVFEGRDVASIYDIPGMLAEQGFSQKILSLLELPVTELDLSDWEEMLKNRDSAQGLVRIAMVGKYTKLRDSYLSINEALTHAAIANRVNLEIVPVDATDLTLAEAEELIPSFDGVLIPYGFGERGMEGKINAIRVAREGGVPFFGICVGLQCAVIEFARHVCGLTEANSTEFNPDTPHPVIDLMEIQKAVDAKGGTMRLGSYPCQLMPGTLAAQAYGTELVFERHRHRYEVNNDYREILARHGMVFSGINPQSDLVEIVELSDHPCFFAVQFHPEFKSRPVAPHPLFSLFIQKILTLQTQGKEQQEVERVG